MFVQAAGISRKLAPTIGISVDPRRKNLSEESLSANVARLKEYTDRLVLFPRRNGKTKKGDASAEQVKAAKQGAEKGATVTKTSDVIPIVQDKAIGEAKISEVKGEENAYQKLRLARSDARLAGIRKKRAELKEEEAAAAKK